MWRAKPTRTVAHRRPRGLRFAQPTLRRRNPLFQREEAGPGIVLQEREPVAEVADRKVIRLQALRQLVPGERCRDGGLRPAAGRIGGDRCGAAVIAEIVDEDAAMAD